MDVDTIRDLVQIITIYDSRPEDFYRLGLEKTLYIEHDKIWEYMDTWDPTRCFYACQLKRKGLV